MKIKFINILLIMSLIFVSCNSKEILKYEDSRFLFGTYIKIIIYDKNIDLAKKAVDKAFKEIERVDSELNSKREGSKLFILNNLKDGEKEIILNKETKMIFDEVKKAYELSDSKYDITIGPLLELWGFTDESIDSLNLNIPSTKEIEYTKKFIGFDRVKIEGNKLILEKPIIELDTGSFLKGYALGKAKEILKKEGIKSAFITSISSIDLIGGKPENKSWKIGLQNPENPRELLGVLNLKDKALGVSGDYQTYVEINGEKYHHILDKETGYPVKDKKMVAVICNDSFKADLYSTTFFLMPIEKVLKFVENQENLEVMIVDKDMNIIKSKGFEIEEIKK